MGCAGTKAAGPTSDPSDVVLVQKENGNLLERLEKETAERKATAAAHNEDEDEDADAELTSAVKGGNQSWEVKEQRRSMVYVSKELDVSKADEPQEENERSSALQRMFQPQPLSK